VPVDAHVVVENDRRVRSVAVYERVAARRRERGTIELVEQLASALA